MLALRGEECVVQVQIGGEELWEVTLLDHFKEHGHCGGKPLLVPVQAEVDKAYRD